uniref:Uncharacterized protein n=1 Tax=Chlamydomonas euryale TaxID=1486919 RepID=A0A7R9VWL4_9CHLO
MPPSHTESISSKTDLFPCFRAMPPSLAESTSSKTDLPACFAPMPLSLTESISSKTDLHACFNPMPPSFTESISSKDDPPQCSSPPPNLTESMSGSIGLESISATLCVSAAARATHCKMCLLAFPGCSASWDR